MISGGELRKGIIIELDGALYQVVDYQHVKMKRTALARVKLRDLNARHTTERSFQSDDKLVRARLDSRPMQYLYNDGDLYHFMDVESFEQTEINHDRLGDALNYLKEGFTVEVSSYKGEVVDIELPVAVGLEVTATEPGFKGDTATAGTKPAKMETGISIQVPLFINKGDVIKVEMSYTELLIPEGGLYEFVYPTVVGPRYSNQSENDTYATDRWVQNPYTHEGEAPLYTFDIEVKIAEKWVN